MPWIIGIDEAGYGPNLGPLVMTSAACRVPAERVGCNLWELLANTVRRPEEPADERIVVGDSKLVYTSARGLGDLETSVLAVFLSRFLRARLEQLLECISPNHLPDVRSEPWYTGETRLPAQADLRGCRDLSFQFESVSRRHGICWGPVWSVVVCPSRFNECLSRWGSKGAVLSESLALLLRANVEGTDEPLHVVIDKHGGRNTYAALLQHALPEGIVVAREEGNARSVYDVLGLPTELRITIQPRADGEHFCVALASMVSKYVRELLMGEFNAFWLRHLPELRPTAGYPGDAARFFKAIKPVMANLGLAESVLWRER